MSTPQEYWDAYLILGWRKFWKVCELIDAFESTTKLVVRDTELLRGLPKFYPYLGEVRGFVASFLPKINERLLVQPTERDVALLKALKTSKYDSAQRFKMASEDKERVSLARKHRNDAARNAVMYQKKKNRNHSTDWNVTK